MTSGHSFGPAITVALAAAVFLTAFYAGKIVRVPPGSFFPSSFVTHSLMLALSVAAMWLISKGRFDLYGFTKGTHQFSPTILLWVLPMAVISLVGAIASHGQGTSGLPGFTLTKIQTIIFIWIYATVCEETLVRCLLQTLLSRNATMGAAVSHGLSMPVLASGLFFGAMHILAFKRMGLAGAPLILLVTFLGLVAAHYREKTGSLLPAIIIHALFNIGGSLPLWMI